MSFRWLRGRARPASPRTVRPQVEALEDRLAPATVAGRLFGISGAGVTVGVISDSADQVGGGIAASQATGVLPPSPQVQDLYDGPAGGTDEGRAMMELVYGIAPGANIDFASGAGGDAALANAVNLLVGAGCNIIVTDLSGLTTEPFFQDGLAARAITNAVAQGVTYFAAAGDNGQSAYEAPFHGVTTTVNGISGDWNNFDASGATTSPLQTVTLQPGTTQIVFQYDEPFYLGGGVQRNADIYLFDGGGNVLAAGTDDNVNVTHVPRQIITYDNTTGAPLTAAVGILDAAGPSYIGRFKYIASNNLTVDTFLHQPGALTNGADPTHGGTVAAISVAASDVSTPTTPEPFTGVGPVTRVFDEQGNRLPAVQFINKPELTASDGVSTSVPGFAPFTGTAAAAANAAAVAALALSYDPTLTPDTLRAALDAGTVDIGATGYDLVTGFGLLDATGVLVGLNNGVLPINGDFDEPGENDSFTIKVDPSDSSLIDVSINGTALTPVRRQFIKEIDVNGAGGDNTLTIDFSNGNPIPAHGLKFDGGSGTGGTLVLEGELPTGPFTNEVNTPTGGAAGTLTLDGSTITYQHLAPIIDTTPAVNDRINGTGAAESINVVDDPNGTENGFRATEVNSGGSGTFEKIDFANKTAVTVGGVGGADTFTVNNPNPAAGLVTLVLTTGTDPGSQFDVLTTAAGVTTNIVGGAAATVAVGNSHSVQGIRGTLNVESPRSLNQITIDDSADSAGRTVTLSTFAPSPSDDEGNGDPYGKIHGLAPAEINYEYKDTDSLAIDTGGSDTFNVTATGPGFATAITAGRGPNYFIVSSDAHVTGAPAAGFVPAGTLDGILGDLVIDAGSSTANRLIVSDYGQTATAKSDVIQGPVILPGTTYEVIQHFAAGNIYYTASGGGFNHVVGGTDQGDGILLAGSHTLATTFTFRGTLGGSTITAQGGLGNDAFNVGSPLNALPGNPADNGNLDGIAGHLTVVGNGGSDSLEADDHGAVGAFNYIVTPTSIANNPAAQPTVPKPTTPPARAFAGISYDSTGRPAADTVTSLRLDGTDQVNIFTVSPSRVTAYLINGNLPPSGVPLVGGGDYLQLDTSHLAGGTGGRTLHLTAPGDGFWTFTDGTKTVSFLSIERFNHVAIIATGSQAGPTSLPLVTVRDAETGQVLYQFLAYENTFRGGVRVAVGDVNGDGIPDVIVAPGPGRTPLVKVFSGSADANGNYFATLLTSFNAFSPTFLGGVYVAVGDVNGDGANDIAVGAGAGWLPQVRVYDGTTLLLRGGPRLIGSPFNAFENTFRGGVTLAVADLNNDGYAEVITGRASIGRPTVNVFSGKTLALVRSFNAFSPTFLGGITLAAGDYNGDGTNDVIVGAAAGWLPQVVVFDGRKVFNGLPLTPLTSYLAAANTFRGGIIVQAEPVGGGNPGLVQTTAIFTTLGTLEQTSLVTPLGSITANTPVRLLAAAPLRGVRLLAAITPPGRGPR